MHLLNVETLKLETFLNEKHRPPYAILSHTWLRDGEEVSFQDLATYHEGRLTVPHTPLSDSIARRRGFQKIARCCCITSQSYALKYAWIDTCCINKESSAELSEGINSMFKWYQSAAVCIAFLEDLMPSSAIDRSCFERCKWFRRGWTLQELLAPRKLMLYDAEWQVVGDLKREANLCTIVSDITRIPVAFLTGATPLVEACVAKKMSWAARRVTTRVEDAAYSLLGVFGINMALIYGEGDKAFVRLQEEIIKQTHDHSILAWGHLVDKHGKPTRPGQTVDFQDYLGALASSPGDFEDCWDYERATGLMQYDRNIDFQITTAGVQAGLKFFQLTEDYYTCQLSCFSWRFPDQCLCIRLTAGPLSAPDAGRSTLLPRTRVLSQYVRQGRAVMEGSPAWWNSSTITLAKSAPDIGWVNGTKRQNQVAGVILLGLPRDFDVDRSYTSPRFSIEVDKDRIKGHAYRIVYSADQDVAFPLHISDDVQVNTTLIAWFISVPSVSLLVIGVLSSFGSSYFGGFSEIVFPSSIAAALIIGFWSKIIVYIWVASKLAWAALRAVGQRLHGRSLLYSTVDRDDVRTALRLRGPSECSPAEEEGSFMLTVRYSPRWTVITSASSARWVTVVRRAKVRCDLVECPREADMKDFPMGLTRWPRILEWWWWWWEGTDGRRLRVESREFASSTQDARAPNTFVSLDVRRI